MAANVNYSTPFLSDDDYKKVYDYIIKSMLDSRLALDQPISERLVTLGLVSSLNKYFDQFKIADQYKWVIADRVITDFYLNKRSEPLPSAFFQHFGNRLNSSQYSSINTPSAAQPSVFNGNNIQQWTYGVSNNQPQLGFSSNDILDDPESLLELLGGTNTPTTPSFGTNTRVDTRNGVAGSWPSPSFGHTKAVLNNRHNSMSHSGYRPNYFYNNNNNNNSHRPMPHQHSFISPRPTTSAPMPIFSNNVPAQWSRFSANNTIPDTFLDFFGETNNMPVYKFGNTYNT